jgi:hypothetical protein
MSPARYRRARRSSSVPQVFLIVMLFVLVVGLGGGFVFLYLRAQEVNQPVDQDQCPLKGPVAQTIVLVDATDTISVIAQQEILQRLSDEMLATQKGARLEVRLLEPGDERTRVLASRCNPGDGRDLDEWTSNPRKRQEIWEREFGSRLEQAFEQSMGQSEADSSPIMRALQAISVERLTRQADRSIPTVLIVISDMMEHTDAFSLYREEATLEAFETSPAAALHRVDFASAEVRLWMIARLNNAPATRLAEFWARWIVANRGTFAGAIQLLGVQ